MVRADRKVDADVLKIDSLAFIPCDPVWKLILWKWANFKMFGMDAF